MNLHCDTTIAENKANDDVSLEMPFEHLNTKQETICLEDVTNKLKVVNQFIGCHKDDINEVKIDANINNLVAVNTEDIEFRNNNSNYDNPSYSVISNTTKCCIVPSIDGETKDTLTKYPENVNLPSCVENYSVPTIDLEDEHNKTNKLINVHSNESKSENVDIIAKKLIVSSNIGVVSSSTDNNSEKEQVEFPFEVPLLNIDAGSRNTHSEDVLVLDDEERDNEPDSSCSYVGNNSRTVGCNSTNVHSDPQKQKKIRIERKTCNYMECVKTIVLDDEQVEGDSDIIDLDVKDNDCDIAVATSSRCDGQFYHKGINAKQRHQYDEIYQENTEMAELIEVCLNMQNTDGMTRVIYKTLIPIYKDTDPDFKKSDAFKNALTRTIILLERQPLKKFSHIKNFCDVLKMHKIRKRVPFITLQKKGGSKDCESNSNLAAKSKKFDEVIDLDDDNVEFNVNNTMVHSKPVKEYPPIEIDDDSSDQLVENGSVLIDSDNDEVIILDKTNNFNHRKQKRKRKGKNLKNTHKKSSKYGKEYQMWRYQKRNHLRTSSIDANKTNHIGFISNANSDLISQVPNEVPMSIGGLLVPTVDTVISMDSNSERIRSIEDEIAQLKKRIDIVEQMEVTSDTNGSPYIVCENLKASIVQRYKEICKLTGTADVKRHEVRLKVIPGHPEGPVRCFEEFLNNNIDNEGNPPFPDIQDVIECVYKANYLYNMNLTHPQIMGEAHALFTQFGKSMQKRRQRREWRDLMSLVKTEIEDPADEDPVLQARLAQNRIIAKKNENDLLERYVNIQQGIEPAPDLTMAIEQSGSDDSEDEDPPNDNINTMCLPTITTVCSISELDSNIVAKPNNSITVDNHPELDNEALSRQAKNVGSTISISCGKFIIEPTINAVPNTVVLEPKMTGTEAKSMSKSDLAKDCVSRHAYVAINRTEFSSEYQNFLVNQLRSSREDNVQGYVKRRRFNSNRTEIITQNTKSKLETASELAKTILSLVQSDLPTNNEKSITNDNREQVDDGIEIFTHTNIWKTGLINTEEVFDKNNQSITNSLKFDNDTIVNVSSDFNSNSAQVSKDADTQIGSVEEVETKEHIVKPEPLDVPRMLEELGQNFSTTIFDIEGADAFRDPFLVIDISDSSDSEAENI